MPYDLLLKGGQVINPGLFPDRSLPPYPLIRPSEQPQKLVEQPTAREKPSPPSLLLA